MKCTICNKELTGRQTKFCSKRCQYNGFKDYQKEYHKKYQQLNKEKLRLYNKEYHRWY